MSIDESKILDYPPDKKEPSPIHPMFDRIMRSVMYFSLSGIIIGILFRIQHWTSGTQIFIVSCLTIAVSGILRYSLRPKKMLGDYLLIIVFAFFPVGYLFTQMHWEYGEIIWLIGRVFLLTYLLYFGWNRFFNTKK